ncbi:MAG: TetR family transcriptional regulator [Nocardioides sp.]
MSTPQTRQALMDAAVSLTAREGVRAVTARAVAGEAGVNQALVFYHFNGVDGLLREAFGQATEQMVETYAAQLSEATTFTELHAVALRLGAHSQAVGQAALLAHVLSAAQSDPVQAELLARSLDMWRQAVEQAVSRLLNDRGLAGAVDVDGLTRSLSAATIGMITIDAVPGQPLGNTLESLAGLAALADRLTSVVPAPITRRALRSARNSRPAD